MLGKGDLAKIIDYKSVREFLVYPRNQNLQDEIKKKIIFVFVSKFLSRIYGICMINAWLSKKKGSTFFNLMTMSDFAYTVAVGMVQAWVGQKHLKCDILRLFTMSLFENI